jgi:NDP-sugar pyrophosphorylase family protein
MKAMILAAGYGKRLRPLTETIPKPLLPIAGQPIMVWNLLLLKRHGITEAIINLHHLGHLLVEALGDGSRYGMKLAYSHEPTLLGSGGGIKQAAPYLKNGPFLALNGDTLSDCNLSALINTHHDGGAMATLALRSDPHPEQWGAIAMDEDSRIVQIKGEPELSVQPGKLPVTSYMFAGLHVLDAAMLDAIPSGPGSIIDVYIALLREGRSLRGYRMDGYWSDIGTPERYREAQEEVAKGALKRQA